MADETDHIARIEKLEVQLAYQDQTIEDLNAAVTAQWKEIDVLKRLVSGLIDQMGEMELAARANTGKEPPPPHY
ncbi:SlyX family protein [Oryzibacter oryziterrae]|uniref:SlyX family protein n=1 Tax=Oryzibacter oryziterrae TaxID=2766474 RepID=UPI001F28AFC5|nr:SlyX family protein [Oryzibacter oryziterrae]